MAAQKKKRQTYVEYDYESAYQEQLDREDAELVSDLIKKGARCIYATKRIDAGDQVELEVYPEFTRKEDVPEEGRRANYNAQAQRNLKDKNARKNCERLINANFTSQDIWITLTYTDKNLPDSMETALENMQRYIKRINYRRKKQGMEPSRYVYVTEWSQDEKNRIRCHHHVVMDGDLTMDEVEKAWKLGRRNETRRLDYDENGLSGLAHYITKDPQGKKRWCASKNLKKPIEHKNHRQFSPRKVEKMARSYDDAVNMIQAAAPGCWFKSLETRYNEFNGKFYFYAKLRRMCSPGDVVTIRDAEDLGFDNALAYEITRTEGPTAWVRREGSKGKTYEVPLEQLHLLRKGGKTKCSKQTKRRSSKR